MGKIVAPLACLAVLLLGGGCDRWGAGMRNEVHEANYIEGTNFRFQGQTNRAIQSFERALHVNPSNMQAHMAIADLFYGTEDFTSAAYHYRRCKRLQEERNVKPDQTLLGLIESCDLQLAVKFSDRLLRQQTDAQLDELRQRLAEREDTLAKLQQELGRLRTLTQPLTNAAPTAPVTSIPGQEERLRVQPAPTSLKPPSAPEASPAANAAPSGPHSTSPRPNARTAPAPAETQSRTAPPPPKPASRTRSYTVRRGDTPASIARRAGITTRALMTANPTLNPTRMRPGQIVQVPVP